VFTVALDQSGSDTFNAVADEPLVPPVGSRIGSVDALRGLTILLMIFVNDLGPAAPSWMHHIQPSDADGMTLADVVFPTFLFIVGVSIPLALERARMFGKTKLMQVGHILTRTAGLLFMGVIYINQDADQDRWLGKPWWGLLAFGALVLAWSFVPGMPGRRRSVMLWLKAIGIAMLIGLLAIFRREPAPAEIPFWGTVENYAWLRPGWWEILGLIGWAYLMGAVLTLVLRRREWLMGSLAVLMLLHLALNHQGGLFARIYDKQWLGDSGIMVAAALKSVFDGLGQFNIDLRDALGSLAGVTVAGCLLGSILRGDSDVAAPRARLSWAAIFVVGLFLAGCVADTFEGINKIAATPTWCLWSSAIACAVWMLLYVIMDLFGLRRWTIPFRPAGANPLVAYFLHPIILGLLDGAGLGKWILSYKESSVPWVVIAGSIAMAFFVCTIAGLLGRAGFKVRL
jgi:heparan-alpha-glucosaminide N-acetyltransferase